MYCVKTACWECWEQLHTSPNPYNHIKMYVENQQPTPDYTKVLPGGIKVDLTFWHRPTPTHAYQISVLSCIITAFASIIGFATFAAAHSPAMLGFGMENLVDLASSAVVVWRFYVAGEGEVTPELTAKLDSREKRGEYDEERRDEGLRGSEGSELHNAALYHQLTPLSRRFAHRSLDPYRHRTLYPRRHRPFHRSRALGRGEPWFG